MVESRNGRRAGVGPDFRLECFAARDRLAPSATHVLGDPAATSLGSLMGSSP
jgi:hypothetical protein